MHSVIVRLKAIDKLIQTKKTGPPAQLAESLKISERQLFTYIKMLKELGAPVAYSRELLTYYYKDPGIFHIGFLSNK